MLVWDSDTVTRHEPPSDAPADLLDWPLNDAVPSARHVLNDPARSGYVRLADRPGEYWIRSGIAGFASDAHRHYFLPERYTDAFDATTTLTYDRHDLYVESAVDARENRIAITRFDHRALIPLEMVEDTALIGPLGKIKDELPRWKATCLTTMLVSGPPAHLRSLAELVLS